MDSRLFSQSYLFLKKLILVIYKMYFYIDSKFYFYLLKFFNSDFQLVLNSYIVYIFYFYLLKFFNSDFQLVLNSYIPI